MLLASPFHNGFSGSLIGLEVEDSKDDAPLNRVFVACEVDVLLAFASSGELEKKLGMLPDPLVVEGALGAAGIATDEDGTGGAAKLNALVERVSGSCAFVVD